VEDPIGKLAYITGRRRAATLRQRFLTFAQISKWYVRRYRVRYTGDIGIFLDYLEMLSAEPCGKSVPRARLAAISMFESFADVPHEQRISANKLVYETVNQIEVKLATALEERADVNKAALTPMMAVFALEIYVASGRALPYLRFIATTMLIKIYAVLRGDDLRGAMASTIRLGSKGLRLKLRRTKSTGAGHKIQWMTIAVSTQCSVSKADWQSAAKTLLEDVALVWDRDYMVAMPNEDLTGPRKEPANYEELRAFELAVLEDLRIPEYDRDAAEWTETEKALSRGRCGVMVCPFRERGIAIASG
jgi:hypothetical protein